MKNRLLVAAIAVPVLFVILFFLPPVVLAVVTAALCAVAAVEFMRAVCGALSAPVRYMTVAAAALMPLTRLTGNAGAPVLVGVVYLLALFAVAVVRYEKGKPVSVRNLLACVFAALAYPTLMGTLNGLKGMENGRLLVLLPVIITFCCDSAAYFAGVYLGKKKITPQVSPHKSLEGFLGGLVGGLALTRSCVGRTASVLGTFKIRPQNSPPVTLMPACTPRSCRPSPRPSRRKAQGSET